MINYFNFIFEKENSIHDLLLEDMIELYQIERERDSFCDFVIMYDDQFSKFKTFLLNELNTSLYLYIIQLTEKTENIELKQYFRKTLSDIHISEFKIVTKLFQNKEYDVINDKKIIRAYDKNYANKIIMLRFIWFMNDYDGEILFPCNHKVIPKKGKLVIFPASWIFPYEEVNNKSSEIITITGFFYKTK